MKLHTVAIRRFRSVEHAELKSCGGLNVLIGKNNSGKSNLLASIDLVQGHLSRGSLAAPWMTDRPQDEFTDRILNKPVQIGIEYDLADGLNEHLRDLLKEQAPNLERSIGQLKEQTRLSVVVAGTIHKSQALLWVQHIGAGSLDTSSDELQVKGMPLLKVSEETALELFDSFQQAAAIKSDVKEIEGLLQERGRLNYMFDQRDRDSNRFYFTRELSASLSQELTRLMSSATDFDSFVSAIEGWRSTATARIHAIEHRETKSAMAAFAGPTTTPPSYAIWLMKQYGEIQMLHLRETREAIGRSEAEALLNLKVTRGGPEQLAAVQSTVRSILGVNIDAFQSESARRPRAVGRTISAEIDIDRFLIDANGAGVREALRLVLDLELRSPHLVLIEEPEVHLHPGLEHAVYQYLRDKSQKIQMFVTTHSTNFVDSVSFQNIYLVAKDKRQRTIANTLDTGDGALQIPAELGLRLSTVFMYDRLLFVEGPSDEAVLRELCKTLDFDLANANVGFVQMGGVRNFAHFAAQATLELLARRQVKMWFIADRDERDDEDVDQMMQRLGDDARLWVLQQREMENYLLNADAIRRLIENKLRTSDQSIPVPSSDDIRTALRDEAVNLRDEVVRLRLSKAVLKSVHLTGRNVQGDLAERIDNAIARLQIRKDDLGRTKAEIESALADNWEGMAISNAPGAAILDKVMHRFGLAFNKEGGDSARLARLVRKESIPDELVQILKEAVT